MAKSTFDTYERYVGLIITTLGSFNNSQKIFAGPQAFFRIWKKWKGKISNSPAQRMNPTKAGKHVDNCTEMMVIC
jgi:hypothetical protein